MIEFLQSHNTPAQSNPLPEVVLLPIIYLLLEMFAPSDPKAQLSVPASSRRETDPASPHLFALNRLRLLEQTQGNLCKLPKSRDTFAPALLFLFWNRFLNSHSSSLQSIYPPSSSSSSSSSSLSSPTPSLTDLQSSDTQLLTTLGVLLTNQSDNILAATLRTFCSQSTISRLEFLSILTLIRHIKSPSLCIESLFQSPCQLLSKHLETPRAELVDILPALRSLLQTQFPSSSLLFSLLGPSIIILLRNIFTPSSSTTPVSSDVSQKIVTEAVSFLILAHTASQNPLVTLNILLSSLIGLLSTPSSPHHQLATSVAIQLAQQNPANFRSVLDSLPADSSTLLKFAMAQSLEAAQLQAQQLEEQQRLVTQQKLQREQDRLREQQRLQEEQQRQTISLNIDFDAFEDDE